MAIPSKQIGQSNEANLLWYIAKELEQIKGILANQAPATTTTTTTVAGEYMTTESGDQIVTQSGDFIVLT